jgi:glycosyltransferase involved in cell wall biosynthesis
LTPGFPESANDTTCLPAFQQFALSLKHNYPGKVITVIALQYPYTKKEYTWFGIKVICIGGSNKEGILRFVTWIKAYRALLRIHTANPIHGIISLWLGECALVGHHFSREKKVKQLIWVIGQDAKKGNRFVKRIKPKSENIVAMSDFLKEELYKNYGINALTVVENGINASVFPEFNTGKRDIDVVGAGWLSPLKNYSLFIDVIYELKKIKPDITAAIIGSGEEEDMLRQKIKKLSLENNVRLVGLMPHKQVLHYMNNAKIFLHTSNYEGNSTVLMEALYSGCYVVSTQALSNAATKNLMVCQKKEEMIEYLSKLLNNNNLPAERVMFNTMDDSAKKIMTFLD